MLDYKQERAPAMVDGKMLWVCSRRHLAVFKLVTRGLTEYCSGQNGGGAKLDKFVKKSNN